jgi:hypothetical protein
MAAITKIMRSITRIGITVDIICSGDGGDHILTIRSDSDTAFQWTYEYVAPNGDLFRHRADEFLHDENVHGAFDEENIFHISAMAMKVKELGRHIKPLEVEPMRCETRAA